MGFFSKLLDRHASNSGAPSPFSVAASPDPPPAPEPTAPRKPPKPREEAAAAPPPEPVVEPPPAPPAPDDPVAEGFDNLVEAFFDSSVGGEETDAPLPDGETGAQVVLTGEAAAELRATFGGIAARHLLPVRQLHRRLAEGPISVEWLALCRPAVSTVGRTAVEMDLVELVRPLDQLAALLSSAERQGGRVVDGEARQAILEACGELVELFPEAFAGEDDPDARDGLIVHAVLRQIPQLGTVSLDKIFAAGLTTVEMLTQASAADLTATSGISPALAEHVRRAVDRYREDTAELRESGSPARVLDGLRAAVGELGEHHRAFCAAPQTRDGARQRKVRRQARRLAQLRAHAGLATLGEVSLVEELQRLPLERALERLDAYLSSFPCAGTDPVSPAVAAAAAEE